MTPQDTNVYLNTFINYELGDWPLGPSLLKQQRMEALLKEGGYPQRCFLCLHVAGTKGKGSTCVFLSHILRAAGYRVGLFTSPHIRDVRERIRVLNPDRRVTSPGEVFPDCIGQKEFCSLVEKVKPVLEKVRKVNSWGPVSYFEVLTLLALCAFQKAGADCAVLETGMGGRLDSTNTVDSCVAGLSPISLDHTQHLGRTIAGIAREKAAIVKSPSQTVIVAPQPRDAEAVLRDHCRDKKARVFYVGQDILIKNILQGSQAQTCEIQGLRDTYALSTELMGDFQWENAAVAIGMAEALGSYGMDVGKDAIEKGVAQTFWPGRMEIIKRSPDIVLDSAHNPASCFRLAQSVRSLFPERRIILVLGVSRDKDRQGILRALAPLSKDVILTRASHARAHCFEEKDVRGVWKHGEFKFCGDVPGALEAAFQKAEKNDVIVVTGSIFVMSEARNFLLSEMREGEKKHAVIS